MESMNKFKILTIVVICMFLFVIGAIYSNTKDASKGKIQQQNEVAKEKLKDNLIQDTNEITQNSQSVQDLTTEIENLNKRIDELSQKINDDNSSSLDCKIVGTVDGDNVEQLTEEAALQEAKVNNKQLFITCSF